MGGDWRPPLEARELSASSDSGRSPLWRWLIAAALGVVVLVVIGRAISVAEGPRPDTPESVAKAFVEARVDGDAGRACAFLSARAQRDMVALVRGVEPTAASAADCEQVVLAPSERSQFTDPELPRLREAALRTLNYPREEGKAYAKVERVDESGPFLELRRIRGEWKLDGLAAERVSFIAGCTDRGAPRDYCRCVFDRLADLGRASSDDFREASRVEASGGAIPPYYQQTANACGR